MAHHYGKHMGHEKEPPQPHGPKVGGKHPPMHSHSSRPKRHLKTGGKKR
jgi:hypothetical protein